VVVGLEDDAEPDLGEYFSNFDLDDFQIIALCRTFANYVAQRKKATKRKLLL